MTGVRLSLVVPVFRPDHALPELVQAMLEHDSGGLFSGAVVVDDGSEERFASVFDRLAAHPRVLVARRDVNGGKGAALKAGTARALEAWPDLAGIVTADADGQHAPRDVARVALALAAEPDRLVLGVRQFDRSVPFRSRIGNVITRRLFRLCTGVDLQDTQTGLRGWPLRLCLENLQASANGFDYELETLLNAIDGEIVQVPIETIYREAHQTSHFKPVRDSIRIYRVLARYWLGA